MKILFAFNHDLNPYVDVVIHSLMQENCPVDSGTDKFWKAELFDYDIVHIQWPETLFDWRIPTPIELLFLRQRLKEIKRQAKIVYTRHNEFSHHANERNSSILGELYAIVESECDAMVHLGEPSRSACLHRTDLRDKTHVVIPNPILDDLYAPFAGREQAEARRRLNLPLNCQVILAFGNFRYEREKRLVAEAFWANRDRQIYLLAPKWYKPYEYSFSIRHPMLFLRTLRKAVWAWQNRMKLGAIKQMSDDEVATYFCAADVVFIQRLNDLNSGNVPMAFYFKKVVVGPDIGNIGEALKATGNPVFDANDANSVREALKQALHLSTSALGGKNFEYASTCLTTKQIGSAHAALYQHLG